MGRNMQSPISPRTTQRFRLCVCYQSIFLLSLAVWILVPTAFVRPETLPIDPATVPSETCTAHAPVTDQCVEAGLRTRREALRTEAAFQAQTPATHVALAEILNQQGDPNGAIEEYLAAIQLDPGLSGALLGLGAVYLDQHEWKQAEDALNRAAQLDSENSQTEFWLGRSRLAQQKFPEAQDALRRATRLKPDDAEAFSDLGLAYMAQGHALEAAKALSLAIQLKPDYAEAHHRLELLRASQQDREQLSHAAFEILNMLFRRE